MSTAGRAAGSGRDSCCLDIVFRFEVKYRYVLVLLGDDLLESLLFAKRMPKDARQKLLYVALRLFTEKGFKETSILEMVEAARVSKTTFYNFFRSKEELLVQLFERLVDEVLDEVKKAADRQEKVSYKAFSGIRRYIELCTDRVTVARLLLVASVGVSQEVEKVRRKAHLRFAELIYSIVRDVLSGTVPEEELKIGAQAMVGAINEVVIQNVITSEQEADLDRLARMLNRIVVGSFSALVMKQSAN